jgi:hypothetical protein
VHDRLTLVIRAPRHAATGIAVVHPMRATPRE